MSDRPHTDPPLAEIIGWTRGELDGRPLWHPPEWVHTCVSSFTPDAPVTEGDMAAWLVETLDEIDIEIWWNPDGAAWHVIIGVNIDTDGPTLSDALEAAVRKVAAGG